MRVFKTKWFGRLAKREGIEDRSLTDAIERAERGLIDADLGGGLIKQRIARPGRGRSGGYRTIIAYRAKDLAVFLYGFAKSDRENITREELASLRVFANRWLLADGKQIAHSIREDEIQEVMNGHED